MKIQDYVVPNKTNLLLMVIFLLANWFAMFYLPLALLPKNVAWGLLLVPLVLATNSYWSLIHEGIHYIFSTNKQVNSVASRLMTITFGTVFQIVQFGHLMHHAYSRTEIDRPEVYESGKQSYWFRTVGYYFKLVLGLYVAEFFGPLIAFLPKKSVMALADKLYGNNPQFDKIVKNRLLSPQSLRTIRFDAIIMYGLFTTTFICYGHYWWLWLIVMLIRGFMVSVADNLPHYATPVDKVRYAYNLSLPNVLSKWILNFNLHRIHHEYPSVPWIDLPKLQRELNDTCEINYFKQALRQFNGLIDIKSLRSDNSQ